MGMRAIIIPLAIGVICFGAVWEYMKGPRI